MKKKRSVIKNLSFFMIGFGILIGIIFPFFVMVFGIEPEIALSPFFVLSCIMAGACVGVVNIVLTRTILVKRLKAITDKMILIKNNVMAAAQGISHEKCDFEVCQLKVNSNDEIGRNAEAYNALVETLALTMSGEELISHLDHEAIVHLSLDQILEVTKSSAGCIFIEREGELVVAHSFGFNEVEMLKENEIILSVASSHNPVHIKYPEDIIIDGILTNIRPKEILVEPLKFNGVRIGVALVATTLEYQLLEINKLRIQLKNLSLALHNAIIHEQIQELAAIDPLTGIFNRRFGITRFKDEFARSIRTNSPLGVVMMDLDHFKKINDNFGHLAGDKVLVSCTKIIKNSLREGDVLLRYGGEEFLLVLPGASLNDTLNITEKIRRIVAESQVIYGDLRIKVTCSMGMTSIPEFAVFSEEALIAKVDEALYQSKNNGRNQVTQAKAF